MEKLRKVLVVIGGIVYLLFGIFHLAFWKLFNQHDEFALMKPLYSKILQMLNVGIIVFFLSLGSILLLYRKEILNSKIGKAILFTSAVFFLIRGLAEFAFPKCAYGLVFTVFLCALIYLIPALKKV